MLTPEKMLGQFFTHPEVALFMSRLVNPKPNENIIDPASGDGEFLYHLYSIEKQVNLYGCEIDNNISIEANNKVPTANIYSHNGLYSKSIFKDEIDLSNLIPNDYFDAVIANPPFNGLKNKVTDKLILQEFELGYKDNKLRKAQSIEVLFFERFIKILKPSGRLCAIFPEGILSDQRLSYLRDWVYANFSIDAIISLPKKGIFGTAYVNTVIICGHKNSWDNKDVFYVRDIKLEDLNIIYDYMKKNKIFIK